MLALVTATIFKVRTVKKSILFFASLLFVQYAFGQPAVISFTPASGISGDTIEIFGTNFTGTTDVSFGGVPAALYTATTDSTIIAIVGEGATGSVSVTTADGTAALAGFTYNGHAPVIHYFTPTSAATASSVIINGSYFTGATAVNFGGIAATSFTIVSDTSITAVVGNGASGNVSITTPNGIVSAAGFTYITSPQPPLIDSFSPISGGPGSIIKISGKYFTGTTGVSFSDTAAISFAVVSDSVINAVVGNGGSGNVRVTTTFGTDTLAGFTFIPIPVPVVYSFIPVSGTTGTHVTINGKNFTGTTAVGFGGTAATSFTIVSDSAIIAVVGIGSSGSVSVKTANGEDSAGGFTFTAITPPTIHSFSPVSGSTGTTVSITGRYFTGTTTVSFGGTAATSFHIVSDTLITAVVGAGASGVVSVTTANGTDTLGGFTFTVVVPPVPVIISFSPLTGSEETTVTISGKHFTGATAVSFGGSAAESFIVVSDSVITAIVGTGTSGMVSVTTVNGTGTLGGFTFIGQPAAPNFALIQFTGTPVGNRTQLQWQTSNEQTISSFILEHSADSILFSPLATVGATGDTGIHNYMFIDSLPQYPVNYYRLKIFDQSGNYTYSSIIGVKLQGINDPMKIYPNPSHGFVIVKHPFPNSFSQISVVDMMGRTTRKVQVHPNEVQTQINLAGIIPGIYSVIWTDGIDTFSQTLFIQ